MTTPDSKSPISASTRLTLAPNVTVQGLGEEEGGVLLKLDTGEMYTVNETTLSFLQALDGKLTIEEVASRLTEEFEVGIETITGDLVEVSLGLADENLVVSGNGGG